MFLIAPLLRAECDRTSVETLLDDADAKCRLAGMDLLLTDSDWQSRSEIWSRLSAIARDDARTDRERDAAVWTFLLAHRFAEIRDAACTIAADHSRPMLAHRVAMAILENVEHDDRPSYVHSDIRALREEAAGMIAWGDEEAAKITFAVATDDSEPPEIRGDAIRALGTRGRNEKELLELLDEQHWFFGAQGQHFLVHSLAFVIFQLGYSDSPEVRARLESMRPELAKLPHDERGYVEWELRMTLEHMKVTPDATAAATTY